MKNKSIISDIRGTGIIEFAFILPVFLMMIMAGIEFGMYFVKEETANRSISTTIQAIQRNPTDASLQTMANNSGGTIINYGQSGNYVCAKSYATYASAQSGVCTANDWSTGTPNGVTPGTPYYVAVKVNVPQSLITPLGLLLPSLPALNISQSTIVQVSGGSGGSVSLPTCAAGEYITSDGSSLKCVSSTATPLAGSVGGGCTYAGGDNGAGFSCWGVGRNQGNNPGCGAGYFSQAVDGQYYDTICIHN